MLGSRPVPCSRSRRSGQSRRRTRRTRLPMRGGSRCPHDTHRQRQRPPRSQDIIPHRIACTTRQTPPCMRHTHLSQDGTHRGTRRRPVCCDECVVGHRACPSVFVDHAQTSHVALSRHSAQWASSQGTHAVPSGVSPLAHFSARLSETNFPAPVRMSHFDAPGSALSAHRSGVPSTTPLRVFSGHDHTCRGPLRTPRRNRSRGWPLCRRSARPALAIPTGTSRRTNRPRGARQRVEMVLPVPHTTKRVPPAFARVSPARYAPLSRTTTHRHATHSLFVHLVHGAVPAPT